jgi:RNA-directed DNA polymerase
LISHINPIIRGWSNYYSTVAAKATFAKLDHLTYGKLRRWAIGRHRNKSERWVARKYWRLETGKWDFATKDGKRLYKHAQTPIRRHVKVKGAKSPFDGDWVYWASRLGSHPELPKAVATLLKRQKGRCAHCGLYFQDRDLPELCSARRTILDGLRHQQVWQLIHRRCHDEKAAAPQAAAGGAREKSPTVRGAGCVERCKSGFEGRRGKATSLV